MSADETDVGKGVKSVGELSTQQRHVVICDIDGTLTLLEGQISCTHIFNFHDSSPIKQDKFSPMNARVKELLGDGLYQAIWDSANSGAINALTHLKFDLVDSSNLSEEHKTQIKDKLLRHDLIAELKKMQTKGTAIVYFVSMSCKVTVEAVLAHAGLVQGTHFKAFLSRKEKTPRVVQAAVLLIRHTHASLGIDYSERDKLSSNDKYIHLLTIDDSIVSYNQLNSPDKGLRSICPEITSMSFLQPIANYIDSQIANDVARQLHQWRLEQVNVQLSSHSMFTKDTPPTSDSPSSSASQPIC